MAIVSRVSREKVRFETTWMQTNADKESQAASVKKVVKQSLTQRIRQRVGMGDTDSSESSSDEEDETKRTSLKIRKGRKKAKDIEEGIEDGDGDRTLPVDVLSDIKDSPASSTIEKPAQENNGKNAKQNPENQRTSFQLPRMTAGMGSMPQLEQSESQDQCTLATMPLTLPFRYASGCGLSQGRRGRGSPCSCCP